MFLLSLMGTIDNKSDAYVPELVLAGSCRCCHLESSSLRRQCCKCVHPGVKWHHDTAGLKTEALQQFGGDDFSGNGLKSPIFPRIGGKSGFCQYSLGPTLR